MLLICFDKYSGKQHCPVCGDKTFLTPAYRSPQSMTFVTEFSILASQRIRPQLLNIQGNPANLLVAIVVNHEFRRAMWFWAKGLTPLQKAQGAQVGRALHRPWEKPPFEFKPPAAPPQAASGGLRPALLGPHLPDGNECPQCHRALLVCLCPGRIFSTGATNPFLHCYWLNGVPQIYMLKL